MAGLENFDYSVFTGGRRPPEFIPVFEAGKQDSNKKKKGKAWNEQHKNTSKVVKHPVPKRH